MALAEHQGQGAWAEPDLCLKRWDLVEGPLWEEPEQEAYIRDGSAVMYFIILNQGFKLGLKTPVPENTFGQKGGDSEIVTYLRRPPSFSLPSVALALLEPSD